MTDSKKNYALFPWFEESGEQLIHPNDLEAVRAFRPDGKVFQVLKSANGYVKIKSGENIFRVLSKALVPINQDEDGKIFEIGETVSIADSNDIGTIEDVYWHHARHRRFYKIRLNGKLKSKRYWSDDFEKTV